MTLYLHYLMCLRTGSLSSNHPGLTKKTTRSITSLFALLFIISLAVIFVPVSVVSAQPLDTMEKTLRIGYFPNIIHSQAVIGLNNGDFQKVLGDNIKIETFRFNAGPSTIESLLANRIDIAYLGPNPAINGYLHTNGEGVRVISGVASGGASFIVRNDSGIDSVSDLGGKKFASPQLGNTQDVALRNYLLDSGFKTLDYGGNVTVLPISNADILTAFLRGDVDGAWVPEPWATRLVQEAGGKVFLDERDLWPHGEFVTVIIAARPDYLDQNPEVVKKLLEAHVDETLKIRNNTKAATGAEFNAALKKITGQEIDPETLVTAFKHLEFIYDPLKMTLYKSANDAYDLGFIAKGQDRPNLSGIYDTALLDEVLLEKNLTTIGGSSNLTGNTFHAKNSNESSAVEDIVT